MSYQAKPTFCDIEDPTRWFSTSNKTTRNSTRRQESVIRFLLNKAMRSEKKRLLPCHPFNRGDCSLCDRAAPGSPEETADDDIIDRFLGDAGRCIAVCGNGRQCRRDNLASVFKKPESTNLLTTRYSVTNSRGRRLLTDSASRDYGLLCWQHFQQVVIRNNKQATGHQNDTLRVRHLAVGCVSTGSPRREQSNRGAVLV